mmetsp:Transcript_36167/g.58046  ORF Transcript_36167/g.58046 Transcript_36167/m.58046 type:complete len:846 (-) Transcript_36167:106-2643(-)
MLRTFEKGVGFPIRAVVRYYATMFSASGMLSNSNAKEYNVYTSNSFIAICGIACVGTAIAMTVTARFFLPSYMSVAYGACILLVPLAYRALGSMWIRFCNLMISSRCSVSAPSKTLSQNGSRVSPRASEKFWGWFIIMQVMLVVAFWSATLINANGFNSEALSLLLSFGCFNALCVAVIVTHGIGGRLKHAGYKFYQPFEGGIVFCVLQAISWALFSLSLFFLLMHILVTSANLLQFCGHCILKAQLGQSSILFGASSTGVVSEILMVLSLLVFHGDEIPKKTLSKIRRAFSSPSLASLIEEDSPSFARHRAKKGFATPTFARLHPNHEEAGLRCRGSNSVHRSPSSPSMYMPPLPPTVSSASLKRRFSFKGSDQKMVVGGAAPHWEVIREEKHRQQRWLPSSRGLDNWGDEVASPMVDLIGGAATEEETRRSELARKGRIKGLSNWEVELPVNVTNDSALHMVAAKLSMVSWEAHLRILAFIPISIALSCRIAQGSNNFVLMSVGSIFAVILFSVLFLGRIALLSSRSSLLNQHRGGHRHRRHHYPKGKAGHRRGLCDWDFLEDLDTDDFVPDEEEEAEIRSDARHSISLWDSMDAATSLSAPQNDDRVRTDRHNRHGIAIWGGDFADVSDDHENEQGIDSNNASYRRSDNRNKGSLGNWDYYEHVSSSLSSLPPRHRHCEKKKKKAQKLLGNWDFLDNVQEEEEGEQITRDFCKDASSKRSLSLWDSMATVEEVTATAATQSSSTKKRRRRRRGLDSWKVFDDEEVEEETEAYTFGLNLLISSPSATPVNVGTSRMLSLWDTMEPFQSDLLPPHDHKRQRKIYRKRNLGSWDSYDNVDSLLSF